MICKGKRAPIIESIVFSSFRKLKLPLESVDLFPPLQDLLLLLRKVDAHLGGGGFETSPAESLVRQIARNSTSRSFSSPLKISPLAYERIVSSMMLWSRILRQNGGVTPSSDSFRSCAPRNFVANQIVRCRPSLVALSTMSWYLTEKMETSR